MPKLDDLRRQLASTPQLKSGLKAFQQAVRFCACWRYILGCPMYRVPGVHSLQSAYMLVYV
jgi:hypothetical protein